MGLDVYLYHSKNLELAEELENAIEEAHSHAWSKAVGEKKFEQLTDDEKKNYDDTKAAMEEAVRSNPKYQGIEEEQVPEMNSKKHPEHMFKLTYLRSSYNPSGINHVLRDVLGKDLYWIFSGGEGDVPYRFKPDWSAVKSRAAALHKEFTEHVKANGAFRILEEGLNPFIPLNELKAVDANSALKIFNDEWKKQQKKPANSPVGDWYSSREGFFAMDGKLAVYGVIPGTQKRFSGDAMPITYLIYKDEEGFHWYLEALEVVEEMADWVLAQPAPDEYFVHWSA